MFNITNYYRNASQTYSKIITSHQSECPSSKIQKEKQERLWRKVNSLGLWVQIKIAKATVENSLEVPLKTENTTIILLGNPTTTHII